MQAPTQVQFDREMYAAALAFYNLPPHYKRAFTRLHKGPIEVKVPCDARAASEDGRVVWVQVNLPHESYPLQPASSQDIAVYQNLVLDFERPKDPQRALDLALDLVERLIENEIAEPHPDWPLRGRPSVPIECTGAGVHICLTLPPLRTDEYGGPGVVDRAVARVVERYIRPEVVRALGDDVDPLINVHAYDIGHLYSCPGTWRPANLKDQDCEELRPGFLRHWYRHPDDSYPIPYPRRRESAVLAQLIATECMTLTKADTTYLDWSIKAYRQQAGSTPPQEEADETDGSTAEQPRPLAQQLPSPYTVIDTSIELEAPQHAATEEDLAFLRHAIAQAQTAGEHGDAAEGAVIVSPQGHVLGDGHSRVRIDSDASAHAEVVAIRRAGAQQGEAELLGCTLYATHEPCLSCTLLANRAGITRIVYGLHRPATIPSQPPHFLALSCQDAANWINLQWGWTPLEVVGGVLTQCWMAE
jgi:tRNA(Arg) A34 adenosine deaminase TadA